MNGTYLAIINNELFESKDRVTWSWVKQSTFSLLGYNKWTICYDNVSIDYYNGLYKMSNHNNTLYSHNGRLWIEL